MDSDMYFYIFVLSDEQNGANMNSERPTTLEASKHPVAFENGRPAAGDFEA